MKLALVLNQFPKFSETFIVTKLVGLVGRGWDVTVLCKRRNDDQAALFPHLLESFDLDASVRVTPDRRTLAEALAEVRPDVVHFEFGGLAVNRVDLAQAVGARSVVSFRGPDLNVGWMDDPTCYDDVWRRADAFHFIGEDIRRRAIELGCREGAHALIRPAVDTEFFDVEGREYRARVGTARRPLRVLSVGRLHWAKGYEYALKAVRLLLDAGVTCEHRVIGGHDHQEHLTAVLYDIDDMGLGDVVSLEGKQGRAHVREAMRWADVLVHASVSEGFCNAVLEAQAMALPVVCSDAGGLTENVVDGRTGFVVPRRDAAALADRVLALASSVRLRRRVGAAARARIVAEFDLRGQVQQFHDLYLRVVGTDHERFVRRLRARVQEKEKELRSLEKLLPSSLREQARSEQVDEAVRHVEAVTPPGATVAIVSRGDDDYLVRLSGRVGRHFPETADGSYAGYHPGTSDEARDLLESARASGAEFLAFPRSSLWWLEHYEAFARHLDQEHEECTIDPAACRVFDLRGAMAAHVVAVERVGTTA